MTLRVEISIVPFGDEEKKYLIKQLDIFNMGMIGFERCEYGVIEIDPKLNEAGLYDKTVEHRRSQGAAVLIAKVISELEIKWNTPQIKLNDG